MKPLSLKYICTLMFTAALFTIAKTWKQPKCPLTDEWIKKMWYIHIHSALESREVLLLVTTWIDLEGIMLSEISQRKTNTVWSHLNLKKQTHRYREQIGGCQRQGLKGGQNGWGESKDKNFQL